MSDLDQLIESWKRSLADLSEAQVDELEDHLRQETDALRGSGLSDREAFTVAAMRCGRPHDLCYEFARADGAAAWSGRLRWMIVGFLACAVANGFIATLNMLLGAALVVRGTSVALAIGLRMLMLTCVIALAIAAWHVWVRRRSELLNCHPPRWLTSGWMLALLVGVIPWVLAWGNVLGLWLLSGRLSANHLGQLAFSGSVTWMVLPFTTPLILLIIAVSLGRRHETSITN